MIDRQTDAHTRTRTHTVYAAKSTDWRCLMKFLDQYITIWAECRRCALSDLYALRPLSFIKRTRGQSLAHINSLRFNYRVFRLSIVETLEVCSHIFAVIFCYGFSVLYIGTLLKISPTLNV